jgi:hypothetical protein
MEQRQDRAYSLTWATDHMEFCDEEFEVEIHEFPGWDWTSGFYKTTPYELPNPVIFYFSPGTLTYSDYPINDVYWPVMSRRMYYVLNSLGDFPHRVIPLAMIDITSKLDQRFLINGQPNPEVTNFDDFVAVQLLEEADYFDFERSEYEPDPDFSEWVLSIDKCVLNEPEKGFPPLFRLAAYSVELFISAEARTALKEAGIRGTAYNPLENRLISEADIPIQLPTYP